MCADTSSDSPLSEDVPDDIFDRLDFSKIAFPSDRLTIAALRHKYPESFDHGLHRDGRTQPRYFPHGTFESLPFSGPSGEDLGSLLFAERLVAASAYAKAKGFEGPGEYEGEIGLQGFKSDLVEFYTTLGIATGEHHAHQLIRDIERQAPSLTPDRLR